MILEAFARQDKNCRPAKRPRLTAKILECPHSSNSKRLRYCLTQKASYLSNEAFIFPGSGSRY